MLSNQQNTENQINTRVAADQIHVTINSDDVNYAIKKLSIYDDPYSTGIVKVFNAYLEHRDFLKMKDELETVPHPTAPLWKQWDINVNMDFLEVIYPLDMKGGQNG